MATLDIFNDDAFSLSALTQTITDIPGVPTQLGDEGLFQEYGINSLSMMIERQGSALKLVPAAPRGAVPEPVSLTGRKLITISGVHLPQMGSVMADEVQGIRAFGSETEVMAVQSLVTRKLVQARANLDLTMEYQRIGALKGLVLDADGTTVLNDLYSLFGFTQTTFSFALSDPATDVKQKCIALKRLVRVAMGGRPVNEVRVKVSETFFDQLVGHTNVKAAYDLWNSGAFDRTSQVDSDFDFAGVIFQIYIGGTSAGDFVPANQGFAYPTGIPGMFQTAYCPANFMETVNTTGLPYYVKQAPMAYNIGVSLYSQSNPITLNTHPEAVIKVTA